MAHPLDGVRLKLARAEEHLDTLEADMGRYLGGDVYMLVRDDEKPDRTVFHLWIKEEPPPRFSIILGDCVHNLRSSLDHIAWQLVLANSQTPDEDTAFPILKRPPSNGVFSPKTVRGMSKEAIALIERMQPYHDGEWATKHFLWFLRELSNADKHRTLFLTVANLRGIRVRLLAGPEERVIAESSLPSGIFSHRAEVASFPIRPDEILRNDVKVESSGDQFIALKDTEAWSEEPILTLLEQTSRAIRFGVLPQIQMLPEMK